MTTRQEFAAHWQALCGATTGMALGLALNHYVMSLFGQALIAEFGWSKAQYALIGATPFFTLILIPVMGRLIDRAGPRAAAAIGFVSLPLGYLALSTMTGSFALFFAIIVVKSVLGTLTTTMVFARVIVERFDRARGLALSIVMSAPSLVGMVATPIVASIIEEAGWRVAFQALALVTAAGGLLCWWLLGRDRRSRSPAGVPPLSLRAAAGFVRSPVLLLAIGGMYMVNLPQVLAASQLTLVLADSGASTALATLCVALYAGGVAVGRLLSGLALDRFAVHKVALCTLGLPAIGLAAIATPFDAPWVLIGSVLLLALAQGAEGDIGAYLISRRFGIANYSLLMSLMTVALTIGAASGSLILSTTLGATGSYAPFLNICAVATLAGAGLFFAIGTLKAPMQARPDGGGAV